MTIPTALELPKTFAITSSMSIGEGISCAFQVQIDRLTGLRQLEEATHEPENVHQMRVSIRKLRSYLRAFERILPARAAILRTKLGDLGLELGKVRDLDIHLKLAKTQPVLRAILAKRQSRAIASLARALNRPKTDAIIVDVQRFSEALPYRKDLRIPTKSVLEAAMEGACQRARAFAKQLKKSSPAIDFHDVRKRTKALRYLAELAPPSSRLDESIKSVKDLLDYLGERQDLDSMIVELDLMRGSRRKAIRDSAEALTRELEVQETELRDEICGRLDILRKQNWKF